MNALLLGFLLFAGSGAQSDSAKTDIIRISAKYDIDVNKISEMPKFVSGFIGGIAQFFGFAPNRLEYLETISPPNENGGGGFRMELKDQSGKEWIHAVSDTSEKSFAEPPESKRDTLNADGIRFISELRKFFRNPDTLFFCTTFRFGKDTLEFLVFRDTSVKIDHAYREYEPSLYRFLSSNQKKELYLRCDFLVGSKNGIVVYPRVEAYLYKKKIGLTISIEELEIKK